MTHEPTLILGAGLAGLGCAKQLRRAIIFEANSYAGGHVYSHRLGGFSFDEGAHICHSRDKGYLEMIYTSAGDVHRISTSKVMNRHSDRWLTYPVHNNLNELPPDQRIKALSGFVKSQMERGGAPANYRDWCLGQYGEFLAEEFYAKYTSKYWRVPMEELATDWLSGRLLPSQVERVIAGAVAPQEESQAVFAQFHYPSFGGYLSFYDKLYAGLDIRYNHRVVEVDVRRRQLTFENGGQADYETLASSIPLPALVAAIKDAPEAVRLAASRLRYTKLLCVNVVVNRPAITDMHWFYIYDSETEASRVSVVSNLGQEEAAKTATAFQAEIFRRGDELMPVESLVENTIDQLSRLFGFPRSDVTHVQPVVVPYAYVISDVHRGGAVEQITTWLRGVGVHTMGLLGKWKYVWSDAAFRDGEATARTISDSINAK